MKSIRVLVALICLTSVLCVYTSTKTRNINLSVANTFHAKMSLLIGVIDDATVKLADFAQVLKNDFSFSGQFQVELQTFKKAPSKKEIKSFFTKGYMLAVFVNSANNDSAIEWRIYDTMQANMVQGKKYKKRGSELRGWAHNCADAMWPLLTGQQSFFSSKIAFCKEAKTKTGALVRNICVADYDGSNQHVLVDMPTVNIAPRWNGDTNKPLLFYSEYTNTNVRLMTVDMNKKRTVASDFDGINMLPAFSQDGKAVVYCASRGDGSCQLYWYQKGKLQRLTHNNGNNVSPTFANNDQYVYFCSDYQTGNPQIYRGDMRNGGIKRITKGGYCTSPRYCAQRQQLVYTKMVHGTMQVYIYDCNKKTYSQLTTDVGNKHECAWSPCGNYLMFSIERRGKSRLALLNLLTNSRQYVTGGNDNCTYPAWSPCYSTFPSHGASPASCPA